METRAKRPRISEFDKPAVLQHMRSFCGINKSPSETVNSNEDDLFRSRIGASVAVVHRMWHLMHQYTSYVSGEQFMFVHYLWALSFLRNYPKEADMCSIAGVRDIKTFKSYAFPFVSAMAAVASFVVSASLYFSLRILATASPSRPQLTPLAFLHRFCRRIGSYRTLEMIVW
jgi:hypothetical protein